MNVLRLLAITMVLFLARQYTGAGRQALSCSFMDRLVLCRSQRRRPSFPAQTAAAVMNARRAGTTATWDQLNKYFGLMQMPIITSRYWNMVHGQTPFEVKQDLEGMQTMAVLGHNMAYFLKCKDAGERMGVAKPMDQPFVFTNFIH